MIKNRFKTICAVGLMTAALTFSGAFGGETAFAATATVSSGSNMSVNMRAGTGTEYDVVAAVPNGASVEIGSLVNGWYEVTYNGASGYIRSDLIQSGTQSADTTQTTDTTQQTDDTQTTDTEPADNTADTADEQPVEETTDSEPTGVTATDGDILIGGTYFNIVNDFTAEQMPEGFSYTAVYVNDMETNAAYNESLNMYLVRLTSTASGETGWFVHDENVTDFFYPYLKVGSSDNYIILKNTNDEPLEGYSKDELPLDGYGILAGFRSGVGDSNHYIVYGVSGTGQEGWYIVDPTTNSYVSSDGMTAISNDNGEASADAAGSISPSEKLYRRIIAGLILIIVIMIIAMVAGAIRRRGEYDDFFDDEDEDDDDNDDDESEEDGEEINPDNRIASRKTVANKQKVEQEADSDAAADEDVPLDTTILTGLDLELINNAAEEENATKQAIIKEEKKRSAEEILRAERAAEKARQQALKEVIKPSERPDNIDIIDLN